MDSQTWKNYAKNRMREIKREARGAKRIEMVETKQYKQTEKLFDLLNIVKG